jgi:tight adherence protein B
MEYKKYKLSVGETVAGIGISLAAFGLIGFVFYDCIWLGFLEIIFWFPIRKKLMQWKMKKTKTKIAEQFREALSGMQAAVMAGYNVENSIREAYKELKSLYGKEGYVTKEYGVMLRQMQLGEPVGKVMEAFAQKTGVDEIIQFAQLFETARRTGGNMAELMRMTGDNIGERLAMEQEIATIINSRRFELHIMDVVPLLIVLYVRMTTDGMMDVLYHNTTGYSIMTVILLAYVAAVEIGEYMMRIEL